MAAACADTACAARRRRARLDGGAPHSPCSTRRRSLSLEVPFPAGCRGSRRRRCRPIAGRPRNASASAGVGRPKRRARARRPRGPQRAEPRRGPPTTGRRRRGCRLPAQQAVSSRFARPGCWYLSTRRALTPRTGGSLPGNDGPAQPSRFRINKRLPLLLLPLYRVLVWSRQCRRWLPSTRRREGDLPANYHRFATVRSDHAMNSDRLWRLAMLAMLTTRLIRLLDDGGRSRQIDAHRARVRLVSEGSAGRLGRR